LTIDYEEDGSQVEPIQKFFDGLDKTNECFPTQCSIMMEDCLEPLDSEYISINGFNVEIS
jgi:hypothetical protein